jgi:hypothetical protein
MLVRPEEVVSRHADLVITAVADRAELSKADAKRALVALEEIVLEELDNAQKVWCASSPAANARISGALGNCTIG